MKIYNHGRELQLKSIAEMNYPIWGIVMVMALLYLAPFLSSLLVYIAFLICIYRVFRYDARVFATDYCMLLPVSTLLQTSGGISLIVFLCLFASIWYLIRNGIQGNRSFVLLVILLNYLLLRMQMDINNFVLYFGQLFLLYVLVPKQDPHSAERSAKLFCASLFLSSAYALLFRNTSQIYAVRGNEVPAYFGSSLMRFQGLFEDPNYYMFLLILGLALLIKLKDCKRIRRFSFLLMGVSLTVFGILTYSKTFFLSFILLGCVYILWQFHDRKLIFGSVLTALAASVSVWVLISDASPFAVVLTRLNNASSISELTTGRSDLYLQYWKAITENPATFFFGYGFAAESLGKATHNLYLEIMYYTGMVGFLLAIWFYGCIGHQVHKKAREGPRQSIYSRYVVVLMVLVVFFTLSGMYAAVSGGIFLLAFLSIMISKRTEVN